MFASGSLDHRVVIWRISSGEKVFTHDFGAYHEGDGVEDK